MTRSAILTISLLLAGCASPAPPNTSSEAPAELQWLAGCWLEENGQILENWTISDDGWLTGQGWSVEPDGALKPLETMEIKPSEEASDLSFTAKLPSGAQTSFKVTFATPMALSFDNPDHDYPQSITYVSNGRFLYAAISMMDGANARSWVYTACPPETEALAKSSK